MADQWPAHLDVAAVRFARPTAKYDDVLEFYSVDLGLTILAQWRGHSGYDGVVLGLPGTSVQMELLQHGDSPVIPAPHPENQLVLYFRSDDAVDEVVQRMRLRGHVPVSPENPYWTDNAAVLFQDPDGWCVVLVPHTFGARDGV